MINFPQPQICRVREIATAPMARSYFFYGKTTDGTDFFGHGDSPAACYEACKQINLLYYVCTPLAPESKYANQV